MLEEDDPNLIGIKLILNWPLVFVGDVIIWINIAPGT